MMMPERVLGLLELSKPRPLSAGKIGDICAISSHILSPILARLEDSGAIIVAPYEGFAPPPQKLYQLAK